MTCDTTTEFIEYWLEEGLTIEEIERKIEEGECDIGFDEYDEEE